jgi:hypothetical protein
MIQIIRQAAKEMGDALRRYGHTRHNSTSNCFLFQSVCTSSIMWAVYHSSRRQGSKSTVSDVQIKIII